MIKKNTALRNKQLNDSLAVFNGGTLEIRTGAQPASANNAATGTLLATINIPNPAFSAASGGVTSKNGTWSAVASATGVAGWARMKSSDGTYVRDFSVGESGADLIIDDDNVTSGTTVTVVTLNITADGA
jgi:hypothetical protein